MTIAVVCNQWGDTGKGKFSDLLAANWADIIVRGNGADNAGHTIEADGKKHVMHLVPSGILHDQAGKTNIIGSGVAINPRSLIDELTVLSGAGYTINYLKIALNAKLILPQHILIDRLKEGGAGKLGTTGRGVGPVYTDHYARIGLIINDLLNPELFRKKLERNLKDKLVWLKAAYSIEEIKEVMSQPILGHGVFYDAKKILDIDQIVKNYCHYGKILKRMICDTDTFVKQNVGRKRILLEGAQGLFLSVDRGSYPYVTSSDCSVAGLAHGAGIQRSDINLVYGIVKAPYMTRVGNGPFPTELGGTESANWCARQNRQEEA
jgi:adenylosuccinate synthase